MATTVFNGTCPICQRNGLTSIVELSPASTTTALGWTSGYFDNMGVYIENENPNIITTDAACSNGHKFQLNERSGKLWVDN